MPTRRRRHRDAQLELAFPEPERRTLGTVADAESLVALHTAVRLVLDVAEGRVAPSADALEGVHASLGVIAVHGPGGRLGHVVRRYHRQPAAAIGWAELVDELAFVLSLTPEEGAPQPTPTSRGGLR
ncbi:MAG: hypothetical protein M3P85_04850 [Actinomycetota bacterium]|nr:hypothetical protein [Actinomycetota bacterium]